MIKQVLQEIMKSGMVDKMSISREVGIQPETLDDIIRLLIDRGYLAMEEDGCEVSETCSSCESRRTCQIMTSSKSYHVTERGVAYARSGT
jgi:hypothetical protein